ncbi:MFS transporter [Nocardioidaceae bacterium]|nr:MFS transporter [Nocardioidaceae bacterium]
MTAVEDLETSAYARRQRRLVSLVMLLGLSCWFSATAVSPSLQTDFGISGSQAVLLTSSVQVGFVVGAVGSAALNLADRVDPTRVVAWSCAAAALATAALAVLADGLGVAVALRFVTGAALAGVYPVLMKVMATWAPSATRGWHFGVLIGALTMGSALPQLIRGFAALPWQGVMLGAASTTLVGGVVAAYALRPGPLAGAGRVSLDPRYALRMFTERGPRLVNLGYHGHMWELYALWTWLPTFVLVSQQSRGAVTGSAVNLTAFAAIGVAGFVGCVLGGRVADRRGRPVAAAGALTLSGACCLLSPLAFGRPLPVLLAFVLVWGAAVIADSGVFSTALSEVADPRYVGTALTTMTAVGYTVTVATIHLTELVAGVVGWQYAFFLLAAGPAVGATAMARLHRRA